MGVGSRGVCLIAPPVGLQRGSPSTIGSRGAALLLVHDQGVASPSGQELVAGASNEADAEMKEEGQTEENAKKNMKFDYVWSSSRYSHQRSRPVDCPSCGRGPA